MNYRIEYRGVPLADDDGMYFTIKAGTPLLDVLNSIPGAYEMRPPTPQERFEDVCREIREQRYVLLRDPNHECWD
jgi:hypothetical protein